MQKEQTNAFRHGLAHKELLIDLIKGPVHTVNERHRRAESYITLKNTIVKGEKGFEGAGGNSRDRALKRKRGMRDFKKSERKGEGVREVSGRQESERPRLFTTPQHFTHEYLACNRRKRPDHHSLAHGWGRNGHNEGLNIVAIIGKMGTIPNYTLL